MDRKLPFQARKALVALHSDQAQRRERNAKEGSLCPIRVRCSALLDRYMGLLEDWKQMFGA